MRYALLWTAVVSLAASAVGRHIPFGVSVNSSRVQHDLSTLPVTGFDSPLPPNVDSASDTPPKDDNDTDEDHPGLAASASDELWYKHMRKGNSLNCGMRGTDAGAGYQVGDTRTPPSAASKWVRGMIDMSEWYWWAGEVDSRICDMDLYWGMRSMFRALEINPKSTASGGDMQCFQILHMNENAKYPDGTPRDALSQSYVIEGKLYHATDAAHFFSMSVRTGVIVGLDLSGPEVSAERIWGWKPTPDQLPKLRNLSDLFWAYWSWIHSAAGARVNNLNKYIVYSIQNPQTDQIIARALRSINKDDVEVWPGQYFSTKSEQGLALLGSPIGATIGYLLMQHKKELGDKYVAGVRILRNDDQANDADRGADLVFDIVDMPPEELIPDAPDQEHPQDKGDSGGLTPRTLPGFSTEERALGPNSVLRLHTIMAY
ncbi:hypothetical protein OPT61_g6997 [Boeremia exigua]|uniref:Uncharacterized protein n=1 Tax=Boeremia exigua TaxID=749465 RepID=A0ACC2I409_9PLEO|nr:hypothetical protein OPT61_g6997 [Boeremia exigua]